MSESVFNKTIKSNEIQTMFETSSVILGLVFVPNKERNWGGVPLFVPLSKLQIFSETRREGRGVTFTCWQLLPTIELASSICDWKDQRSPDRFHV